MKHGMEHLGPHPPTKGRIGTMSQVKWQVLTALTDLEFWCLIAIGLLLLIHN